MPGQVTLDSIFNENKLEREAGGWEINTGDYKTRVRSDQGLGPSNGHVNHAGYRILCHGFSQKPFPYKELTGD